MGSAPSTSAMYGTGSVALYGAESASAMAGFHIPLTGMTASEFAKDFMTSYAI